MTKRLLLATSGLYVSKPGLDVSSANDEDFLITPNRPIEQPFLSGHIVSDGSTVVNLKISHGLGYVPVVLVFGTLSAVGVTGSTVQLYGSIVDTSALHIRGLDSNQYYVNYQGGGRYQNYAIDAVYVIFRTQLTAS